LQEVVDVAFSGCAQEACHVRAMSQTTQTIRVFISSPGDVAEERAKARQVLSVLQRQYGNLVELVPVMWEDLAIPATASLQEGIDRLLEDRYRVDIAVFILWSRLGNPIGGAVLKRDGSPYRSGTEREFDMMLAAHERGGGRRPVILAYTRDDDEAFSQHLDLRTHDEDKLEEMLRQRRMVKQFIKEKFLDDQGRSVRAYHIYREPVGFAQRLHAHLRGVLFEFLSEREPLAVWTEAPYRGLEVFDVRHAPVFFGRDEETCSLLQRLRERKEEGRAFVCIVGASGSGKSSLARAGVAATLIQRSFDDGVAAWHAAVFTPSGSGGDLFEGFARSLAEALPALRFGSGGLERFAKCLAQGNEEAASILFETAAQAQEREIGGAVRVLLVMDQLDELWTESWIAPEVREKFFKALEWLAGDARAAVLATLRSDFYQQAQGSETFLRLKGERGHFDLAPPGTAALQQLIVQPAQRAGLRFERDLETGRSLDQIILEDAAKNPGALPLLQYALLELHARREARTGTLPFAAYREMGGVEGALARRAAQLIDSLPPESRNALEEILPLLVSIDGGSERWTAVRRSASLEDLNSTPARRHLVGELVKARFLVAEKGTAMLSHEALLRNWERVVRWIEENRSLLRLRARIEKYHAIWEESGRDKSALLPPGSALRDGQSLLERGGGFLETGCREFLLASIARRRAAFLWRAAAAALVLAGVGAGLFQWWDHSRIKTEYFSQLTEEFGVPRGVFPLDATKASARASTYLLEISSGKIRRAAHINGSGTPVEDLSAPFRAAVREIEYREDGSVQAVVFRARNGRLLATHLHSPVDSENLSGTVEVRSGKRDNVMPLPSGAAGLASENPLRPPLPDEGRRSEISAFRLTYNPRGLPVRKMFFNVYGTPRPDLNGAFGVALAHDGNGLVVERVSLDRAGKPSPEKGEIEKVVFERGPMGAVAAVSHFGSEGRAVRVGEGWHRQEIARDVRGNPERVRFLDEAGRPTTNKDGYASHTERHDARGNLVEVRFLGEDGQPVHSQEGSASWTADYDPAGNQISIVFLDTAGKRILIPHGHAEKRFEYDSKGNLLRVSDLGVDGKPILTREGIAGARRLVDEHGNLLETSFFGLRGEPVLLDYGYAKWTSRFDERGNEVEVAFFGVNGEPVLYPDGYARWTAEYDERGNKAENRFFGTDGKPCLQNQGCASWKARFDEQGNLVERTYFGIDGELVTNHEGISGFRRVYDALGNRVEQEFFGVDGRPARHMDGYARWTSKYDGRGNEIEAAFFGVDGLPAMHKDGYARWSAEYDERDSKIVTDFFGIDGRLVLQKGGYSRWVAKYDERGKRAETVFFGLDGEPVDGAEGWSREVVEYNKVTGHEVRRMRFDKNGRAL
jgi:hypothetical protein